MALPSGHPSGLTRLVADPVPPDGHVAPSLASRAHEAEPLADLLDDGGLGRAVATGSGEESDAELLARQLTSREVEVLQLLSEGASSKEISERLSVSPNTVRTHVQGILTKLQVHSRLEAAAFAVRHKLVKARS